MKNKKIYAIIIILTIIMTLFINISTVQAKPFENSIDSAQSFTSNGKSDIINYQNLYNVVSFLYNVAMTIGIIVAIIIGITLGIRIIFGGIDERADSKHLLVPYLVTVVIMAFAFTIWKILMQLIYNRI